MSTGFITIERLTHFQCSVCRGWWSIGDAPERPHWFCPWCGARLETLLPAPPLPAADPPPSALDL